MNGDNQWTHSPNLRHITCQCGAVTISAATQRVRCKGCGKRLRLNPDNPPKTNPGTFYRLDLNPVLSLLKRERKPVSVEVLSSSLFHWQGSGWRTRVSCVKKTRYRLKILERDGIAIEVSKDLWKLAEVTA